jgi:hypothetical protein
VTISAAIGEEAPIGSGLLIPYVAIELGRDVEQFVVFYVRRYSIRGLIAFRHTRVPL